VDSAEWPMRMQGILGRPWGLVKLTQALPDRVGRRQTAIAASAVQACVIVGKDHGDKDNVQAHVGACVHRFGYTWPRNHRPARRGTGLDQSRHRRLREQRPRFDDPADPAGIAPSRRGPSSAPPRRSFSNATRAMAPMAWPSVATSPRSRISRARLLPPPRPAPRPTSQSWVVERRSSSDNRRSLDMAKPVSGVAHRL
jgi:hypothetical protein